MPMSGRSTGRVTTHHLTVRVAWHDSEWDGTICRHPSQNSYCLALKRIREGRVDAAEDAAHGRRWDQIDGADLPPCVAESGGFLSPRPVRRLFQHPYQSWSPDHQHLKDTWVDIPPYSFLATPYRWMLAAEGPRLEEELHTHLSHDKQDNQTAWVWNRERQNQLLGAGFGRVGPGSLVLAYCKDGHPLAEGAQSSTRLVVGAGFIEEMSTKPMEYLVSGQKLSFPMWDRIVQHSIRRDAARGVLIPYHAYLALKLPPEEKERLLQEIAVIPDSANILDFSYGAEFITPDSALSVLRRLLTSVQTVQKHGLVAGPWQQRMEWLSAQIAECWSSRGAWPGLGSVLQGFGIKYGGALCLELLLQGRIGPEQDPWPLIDQIVLGLEQPPGPEFVPHLAAQRRAWQGLNTERKKLLRLLSRFALTPGQARRWYRQDRRPRPVTDLQVLQNPYLLAELDEADENDGAIPLSVIDRGLLPDSKIITVPIESPSNVETAIDERRVRAVLTEVLKLAARRGDTALRFDEVYDRVQKLAIDQPPDITEDWINGDLRSGKFLDDRLQVDVVPINERDGPKMLVSLTELRLGERNVGPALTGRAKLTPATPITANWGELLRNGPLKNVDLGSERSMAAFEEQVAALQRITSRKLGVLIGPAGTGKTTVLGALAQHPILRDGKITFLAPTGKARVRLQQATGQDAKTVAQFLFQHERYNTSRQQPILRTDLTTKIQAGRTLVIDEASMLTIVDIYVLLMSLDANWTQRVILVGDPSQLPPIGPGRPFADLVAKLDGAAEIGEVMAKLTTSVRGSAEGGSAALQLAAWYSADAPPAGSDAIFEDLARLHDVGDISLRYWQTPDELHQVLSEQLQSVLALSSATDKEAFNASLGITATAVDADRVDRFQLLSPVRHRPFGTTELNRTIQSTFRAEEVRASRSKWGVSVGDEDIVKHDKVIQVRNQQRYGAVPGGREEKILLANGELGIVVDTQRFPKSAIFVKFERRPEVFRYLPGEFSSGSGPLELAYALTVHKAQGSEFQTVFVILPKNSPIVSRELLYTALTRAKQKLVLLVEGEDLSELFELSSPSHSETGSRSTHLFGPAIRRSQSVPYAEGLVHVTKKGDSVRSKSELYIADRLFDAGFDYQYEPEFHGPRTGGVAHPDFVISTLAGEALIVEHLGRMDDPVYRARWDHRRSWYLENGYEVGRNIFTTDETGFGADKIDRLVEDLRSTTE